jgi:hypothetical protein
MEIFVGLELDDKEAAGAVDGEEVEHAAVGGGEGGYLAVDALRVDAGLDVEQLLAEGGLEPALRLEAVEGILPAAAGFASLK